MEWCYLFLVIRLTLAEVTTRANIAFVPQTPIALADSIELIEIAVPFRKPLDINWSAFSNFSKTLKEMETRVWREAQWGYCNNQKLNGIVENSQNTLITSLQKRYFRDRRRQDTADSRCEDFCKLYQALGQDEKVSNLACSGSCCRTCFGAHSRKNSLQNALHLPSLSGLRRKDAANCKSLRQHGVQATPFNERHRQHNTHPGQRKTKTAGTNENYLEL